MQARTEEELQLIRKSGQITALTMKKVIESVKAGMTLKEVDKLAEDEMIRLGGTASFKTVPGYHWATCLCINDEVVHGIPRDITLKDGDKLSIDLGAVYQGWHTDTSWSIIIGGGTTKLLEIGEKAMWLGIDQAKAGNHVGDISNAIQSTIEGAGFWVVRSLVGHGVGRKLHEDPEIPGFGRAGTGPQLIENMTIAIEAIYAQGTPDVVLAEDGWTIVTADGSQAGFFEMSVIVGKNGPEVLTDWRNL